MIDLNLLSDRTLDVLAIGGWFPGRQVEVADKIEILKEEGFQPNSYAIEVAKELNGLRFTPPHEDFSNDYRGDIEFCLDLVSGIIDRDVYLEYLKEISESTFPIGMVYGSYFLHVSGEGNFYFEGDGRVVFLGKGIEIVLNILATGLGEVRVVFDGRGNLT